MNTDMLKRLPAKQRDAVLSTLSYREREILRLLAGLSDGHEYTYEEVGHIFKLSNRKLRELVEHALGRIGRQLGGDESPPPTSLGALDIYIDPGAATPAEIAELLTEISQLYRMLGGSGVSFTVVDAREPAIA